MTIIFKIKAEHNKIVQPFFFAEELNQIILKFSLRIVYLQRLLNPFIG